MTTAKFREAGHRLLILLVTALVLVGAAHAHRQPEVAGTLKHDVENGQPVTKVIWRMHAHDAMRALATIPEVTSSDLDDEISRIELAGYVSSWVDYSGGEVTTLGAEVEGNYIYVYQLVTGHAEVKRAGILSDVLSGWSVSLNIEGLAGEKQSVTFTSDYPEGVKGALKQKQHSH